MTKRRGWRWAVCAASLAVATSTSVARADEDELPVVAPEDPGEPTLEAETMNPDLPSRLEERIRDTEEVRDRGRSLETRTILETRVRCEVPCAVSLRRPIVLRVAGEGIAPTDWITVQSDVRSLLLWPGSGPARTAGLVLGGLGIVATIVAAIATPFLIAPQSTDALPYAGLYWGTAIALVAPGAGLYFGNATHVRDNLGRTY